MMNSNFRTQDSAFSSQHSAFNLIYSVAFLKEGIMTYQDMLVIRGQVPLQGDLEVDGNKNAALPLIAASILSPQKVILRRVPQILDVKNMCEILTHMNADISIPEADTLVIDTANLDPTRIHKKAWEAVRAAILFVGPILSRFGKIAFPTPGGDVIGRRRLDTHFLVFKDMGASIDVHNDHFVVTVPPQRLHPASIFLDEASVTATENALMVAAAMPGTTTIDNAACEPHVQDLTDFLIDCGAQIEGRGSNRLIVHGSKALKASEPFVTGADYIQTGAFIGIALCTNSELRIHNAGTKYLKPIQIGLKKFGVTFRIEEDDVIVPANQPLKIVEDAGTSVSKLDSQPWPGFPSDLTSTAIVLATQAEGAILIHEKLYESRLFFVDKLVRMGACITLCDPHRAIVIGRTNLFGTKLESPDIRAGIALVTAALCASGETRISHAHQIDRGFYQLEKRLAAVGAQIKRIRCTD
jgi:UDP-N-acetylglucosamine 1-carboxyvinyltransferase